MDFCYDDIDSDPSTWDAAMHSWGAPRHCESTAISMVARPQHTAQSWEGMQSRLSKVCFAKPAEYPYLAMCLFTEPHHFRRGIQSCRAAYEHMLAYYTACCQFSIVPDMSVVREKEEVARSHQRPDFIVQKSLDPLAKTWRLSVYHRLPVQWCGSRTDSSKVLSQWPLHLVNSEGKINATWMPHHADLESALNLPRVSLSLLLLLRLV